VHGICVVYIWNPKANIYPILGVGKVYGHFGPKTLRTQDISALVPVPKCLVDNSAPVQRIKAPVLKCPWDTSAPVPKCLGHFGP